MPLIDFAAHLLRPALIHGKGRLKLDVDGWEPAVPRGAETLLRSARIRDVIFEHHEQYPSDVARFLQSVGMTLFRLHRYFRKPALLPP